MHERARQFSQEPWIGGVIGLGYVGLPLAVTLVDRGLSAVGYDRSVERIEMLGAGRSPVGDVTDDRLEDALDGGLNVTTHVKDLANADAIFICVPSPLGRNREPDLSFIAAAAETITEVARPGMLVALESTTYPGTTEEIIVPAVEKAGLKLDENVFVAFSPERVSPGDEMKTGDIPKVVGGVSPASTEVAAAAYRRIVPHVHTVRSARAAEMAKLLENTYRAVNIGLINEMAQLAAELDIDIWEVIDAAATKPFGFQAFYPGPGVGGHCIPLDPQFLAWRAKEANFATRFIDLAEQVNTRMPIYTASRIADILNERGLPVFGTPILGVGISYKPNIADDRESASLGVLDELVRRGAVVSVLDPVVGTEGIRRRGYEPVDADAPLDEFALAAVLSNHDVIDLERIAHEVPVVFDTRGAYRRAGLSPDNVVSL
ncbi:MAG: nucleotide sugar dehydrogenase [Acidimicrobiia bacterium]